MTPLVLLKEIILESGFPEKSLIIPSPNPSDSRIWSKITINDRSYINNHLMFTAAINIDGIVWFSKGSMTKHFGIDIHGPDSIGKITTELKEIRRLHEANT